MNQQVLREVTHALICVWCQLPPITPKVKCRKVDILKHKQSSNRIWLIQERNSVQRNTQVQKQRWTWNVRRTSPSIKSIPAQRKMPTLHQPCWHIALETSNEDPASYIVYSAGIYSVEVVSARLFTANIPSNVSLMLLLIHLLSKQTEVLNTKGNVCFSHPYLGA